MNTTSDYTVALPILLEHLPRPYPPPIREGIARALAVPGAGYAWDRLANLYEVESNARVKGGLAVALEGSASHESLPRLIDLLRDQRLGTNRVLLLRALFRLQPVDLRLLLAEFETDPDLRQELRATSRSVKTYVPPGG